MDRIKEEKKDDIVWEIRNIVIPQKSKKAIEDVKELIVEAMRAYGFLHSTEGIRELKVKFL